MIESIEDIDPGFGEKLLAAGVDSLAGLLEAGRRPRDRRALAAATRISQGEILRWVSVADLCRIRGLETSDSELLRRAGVDTVRELRNRNAKNLTEKLAALNEAHGVSPTAPECDRVQQWIDRAKALPLIIEI